ncbi:hypothetical protein YWIDRAFT_01231 [Streptomyces sp. SceaMP-e96]|uniref:Uncharacterized protein n=3 Tax=Streptomyces nigrescens TaxID=1920 RepID=A0A640TEX8_STRNI|nr:hypothetical protein Sliba_27860 [Streptomyces libani subsp. libani]GGV90633.1 hypothetical protein GCM10010500_18680 [Streptomyces libani subsp. libani]SCK13631.1 hypothetical protein YWIDRAFT_01231 [Streptomyces sp. SceaMP-e96]
MRKMSRSLAVAVTSVAVAGIAFAGVAPASAAPVGTAAASSAKCDSIEKAIRQHTIAADKYQALAKKEAGKAHPDRDKVAQYKAKAKAELSAVDAYQVEYARQCKG